jgi:hypothetical protein
MLKKFWVYSLYNDKILLLARKLDRMLNVLTSVAGLLFVEFSRTRTWESIWRQWARKFLISSVLWTYFSCLRYMRNEYTASLSGDAPFQIQVWFCVPTVQHWYLLLFRNTTKYEEWLNKPKLKNVQSVFFNLLKFFWPLTFAYNLWMFLYIWSQCLRCSVPTTEKFYWISKITRCLYFFCFLNRAFR